MHLVMFDIDGTLTQTFAIDADCYVQAVTEITRLSSISTDWAAYRHTSDSGILDEIYRLHFGRPPQPAEIEAVRERFFAILRQAAQKMPGAFEPVPGARPFLEHLFARGHAVALASGSWEKLARLKLALANLAMENISAAFSDDAPARTEIMLCSRQRACRRHHVASFDDVTYFGDGVWDARASHSLGWRFIGVGRGDRAQLLHEIGAAHVVSDYLDLEVLDAAVQKKSPLHLAARKSPVGF